MEEASLPLANISRSSQPDVFIGIEAFAGYRSRYQFRNFRLADHVTEFQVASELAISNQTSLALGGYSSAGDSGYSHHGGFVDWRWLLSESTTVGVATTARSFRGVAIESGFEVGLFIEHELNESLSLRLFGAHDFAANGQFASLELRHDHQVNRHWIIETQLQTSFVSNYYQRSDWNDLSASLSLRYRPNAQWSIVPFLGYSYALAPGGQDTLFVGVNFEFLF